jgi:outer membrane protein
MKKIIIVTFLLMIPVLASAQLKVGIMSPDDVLDAMPEAAQVQTELENFIQQRQNSFQARYQEWISDLTEYAELIESGNISEAEQSRREQALADQQEELNSLQQQIERQIQQRQAELFNPLLVKVEEAMAEVSQELGLDFVLNKTSNTGDPIVYYASQRAADITERVIQKLTQN